MGKIDVQKALFKVYKSEEKALSLINSGNHQAGVKKLLETIEEYRLLASTYKNSPLCNSWLLKAQELLELAKVIQKKKNGRYKILEKHSETELKEKFKKLLRVSARIKISSIANYLRLDESSIWEYLVDWAEEFGFIINGDEIVLKKEG